MWGSLKFLLAIYRAALQLLDPDRNALRFAPPQIKYGASILLACLWCLSFGVYIGELWSIGYNMLGHIFVLSMVFVTWTVFKTVTLRYPERNEYELLRDPNRTPKCYEMTEEERISAVNKFEGKNLVDK